MTSTVLINPESPSAEKEKVDAILQSVEDGFGFIPDGLTLYGISPPLLETFTGTFGYFMGHDELTPELFTMIRYLVSSEVNCSYCIDFNGGLLIDMGKTAEQLQATRENIDHAPLSELESALLKISIASVNDPVAVTQDDLQKARDLGASDRNIFDVVVAASSNKAFTQVLRTFNVIEQGKSFS